MMALIKPSTVPTTTAHPIRLGLFTIQRSQKHGRQMPFTDTGRSIHQQCMGQDTGCLGLHETIPCGLLPGKYAVGAFHACMLIGELSPVKLDRSIGPAERFDFRHWVVRTLI